MPKTTGQAPFTFSLCDDLYTLPERARPHEVDLHGGFAVDPKGGSIYYGMPGCGIMRISADLTNQDIIDLPSDLQPLNFHSTKIIEFDGKQRLVLPANGDETVVVMGLDGSIDFRLSRPEFDEYRDAEVKFMPTDTAYADGTLFVADGYGANYISAVDLQAKKWGDLTFGGKTEDPHAEGLFGTAHGLAPAPDGHHLSIADRPNARFQHMGFDGHFHSSHCIPDGSKPCGIDFEDVDGKSYAVVGSLDDPQEGRAAPIYVLDAHSYEVVSTIRPKEDLGVELADHIHNTVWYQHNEQVYLICQAWNPGHYFVLARES